MRDKILYILGAAGHDPAGARFVPDHRISAGTQSGRDLQDHLLPCADGDYGADLRDGGVPSSILFLVTKNFKFDALAVAVTEVGPGVPGRQPDYRLDLGPRRLGHLVDLGRAADVGAGLLAAVRRLPDAAQRD